MDRVNRITSILSYMVSHKPPYQVTEISNELKITKSSVSRILSSLNNIRWVKQLENEQYEMDDKFIELCLMVVSGMDIRKISAPYLIKLNEITSETVGITMRIDSDDIIIDAKEGNFPVRHVLPVGGKYPLWIGATGKTIMAYMDKKETDKIIKDSLKSGTLVTASGQAIDVKKLKEEIKEIKRTGYAISLGERTPTTAAVAAPIFERNKIIGSIIITGPLPRFDRNLVLKFSSILVDSARKISARLGSTT